MLKTIYFNLFFLFGILSTGIIGNLTDEENKGELHVRRKRVISKSGEKFTIDIAPYIVQITQNNKRHCMGSILSPYIVLTTAHCVENEIRTYQVLSGAGTINYGLHHNITEKIIHENFHPHSYENDIALIMVNPLIPNTLNTQPIRFHEKNIREDFTTGTVYGWDCNIRFTGRRRDDEHQMQRIVVPIVNTTMCAITYLHYFEITEKNLCTFDKSAKNRCGVGDYGSPLVVRGKLAGMYIWSGMVQNRIAPDVYLNLKHPYYLEWVSSKLRPIIDLQLRNHNERHDPARNSESRHITV